MRNTNREYVCERKLKKQYIYMDDYEANFCNERHTNSVKYNIYSVRG